MWGQEFQSRQVSSIPINHIAPHGNHKIGNLKKVLPKTKPEWKKSYLYIIRQKEIDEDKVGYRLIYLVAPDSHQVHFERIFVLRIFIIFQELWNYLTIWMRVKQPKYGLLQVYWETLINKLSSNSFWTKSWRKFSNAISEFHPDSSLEELRTRWQEQESRFEISGERKKTIIFWLEKKSERCKMASSCGLHGH